MKNPNGYGSVVKLKGKRRNPYVVRKTTGWNEKGHPIYFVVGYYPTRKEGLVALADFNKAPRNMVAERVTLKELYQQWEMIKLARMKKTTANFLRSGFKYMQEIQDMKYCEIKSYHMQDCIDSCGHGHSTQSAIKSLFGHLDKFALETDVISKGYAKLTVTEPVPESTKTPFTDEEIQKLWSHINEPWVDTVVLFLYTGFRISELLGLKKDKVFLNEGFLRGGVKTQAGKNRIIPIHSKIKRIIEKYMKTEGEYLICINGRQIASSTYYVHWYDVMRRFGMTHKPHECRHTLRSRLDSAGANKKCIDLIMGHKSRDVGERVYTHKSIDELKETIELM